MPRFVAPNSRHKVAERSIVDDGCIPGGRSVPRIPADVVIAKILVRLRQGLGIWRFVRVRHEAHQASPHGPSASPAATARLGLFCNRFRAAQVMGCAQFSQTSNSSLATTAAPAKRRHPSRHTGPVRNRTANHCRAALSVGGSYA